MERDCCEFICGAPTTFRRLWDRIDYNRVYVRIVHRHHYGHLVTGWGKWSRAVRRSFGNRVMPVQLPCSFQRFDMEIVRHSCGLHSWCSDCARAVRSPYVFFPNDHLKSCDFRKISARPQLGASMTCLWAMSLRFFFSNLS